RSSDNIAPVADIRPPGDGHSQRRVDEGECQMNERDQLFTAESTYQHGAELGPVQQRAQQSVKCSAFSSKLSNSSVGIFGGRRRLTRPLFGCGVT
ncbi:MAG: hypothetical protein CMQ16_08870, partial [Gammaproteobacteria bacterium]|nr:hypothetical protein [Gammaproteobacteria bacterium]